MLGSGGTLMSNGEAVTQSRQNMFIIKGLRIRKLKTEEALFFVH